MKNINSNPFENIKNKTKEFIQNEESGEINPIFEKQMDKKIFFKKYANYFAGPISQKYIEYLLNHEEDLAKLINIISHQAYWNDIIRFLEAIYETNNNVDDVIKLIEAGFFYYQEILSNNFENILRLPGFNIKSLIRLCNSSPIFNIKNINQLLQWDSNDHNNYWADKFLTVINNIDFYEKLINTFKNEKLMNSIGAYNGIYALSNILDLSKIEIDVLVEILHSGNYNKDFVENLITNIKGHIGCSLFTIFYNIGLKDKDTQKMLNSIIFDEGSYWYNWDNKTNNEEENKIKVNLQALSKEEVFSLSNILAKIKFNSIKDIENLTKEILLSDDIDAIPPVIQLLKNIFKDTNINEVDKDFVFELIKNPKATPEVESFLKLKEKNLIVYEKDIPIKDVILAVLKHEDIFSNQNNIKVLEFLKKTFACQINLSNIQVIAKELKEWNFLEGEQDSIFQSLLSSGLDLTKLSESKYEEIKNIVHNQDKHTEEYIIPLFKASKNIIDDIKNIVEKVVKEYKIKDAKEINLDYFSQVVNNSNFEFFKLINYKYLSKEKFKEVFGNEAEIFLESLPNNEIERRNAFTNNLYDRTLGFIEFILNKPNLSQLYQTDKQNILILSKYIKQFGFNKSEMLLQAFFAWEKDQKDLLPKLIQKSNIQNIKELGAVFEKIKNISISENSFNAKDIQKLNSLEKEILLCETNYYNHKWFKANPDRLFSVVPVQQNKLLKYHEVNTESISTFQEKETNISDQEKLVFNQLRQEIYDASQNTDKYISLKEELVEIYNQFAFNINLDKMPETVQNKIKKEIKEIQNGLQEINSIDDLFINALKVSKQNIGKNKERILSILRQICFQKLCKVHQNRSGLLEQIETRLSSEKTPSLNDIDLIYDLFRNHIKDHVANINDEKSKEYWKPETIQTLQQLKFKNINKLIDIGSSVEKIEEIRKKIMSNREKLQSIDVKSIPDTGLIGEMSGYLGDACYTSVVPLLAKYPNLVPYKFVAEDELVGSCLVFKVDDINNEPVLLIRALNLPKFEDKIDISDFVEKYFDQIAKAAKKQGIKKIIAAPSSGTISNYQGVTNYVTTTYGNNEKIKLKEPFNFNRHDITNQCILVRENK